MRVLAMYLPQFHRIEENDRWWGKGYTEWTAVKGAEPLYKEHRQPRIPLKGRYYDLMDKAVMEEQARLMRTYGVDGLCFYHYYFKHGKKLLEKPIENLLGWKDIDMPFCFSWANETWIRTWSRLGGNTNKWTTLYENKKAQTEIDGVLVEQGYGDEQDWRDHFYYLLPFFKDRRYIKKDGHPVFILYKAKSIYCMRKMKQCWDALALKEGIPPVYLLGTNDMNADCQGILLQEPQVTLQEYYPDRDRGDGGLPRILDYDHVWEDLLSKDYGSRENINFGGFIDYDDTPRHGTNGTVIQGASPEKFQRYLARLMIKSEEYGSDFIFLNAWNEWAEGMYLEPDEEWGYSYLEAIAGARKAAQAHENSESITKWKKEGTAMAKALPAMVKENEEEISRLRVSCDRNKQYADIYARWLKMKLEGEDIGDYLLQHGYRRIAVYGMGMLGRCLLLELSVHEAKILYGIDAKGQFCNPGIPIYRLQDELPEVDLVIVTFGYAYEEIILEIEQRTGFHVIALKDLLYEM